MKKTKDDVDVKKALESVKTQQPLSAALCVEVADLALAKIVELESKVMQLQGRDYERERLELAGRRGGEPDDESIFGENCEGRIQVPGDSDVYFETGEAGDEIEEYGSS